MLKLLTAMSQANGSDLFIAHDFPPSMKVQGAMTPLTSQKLTGEITAQLARVTMNERQREEFEREMECNFAIAIARPVAVPRQRVHAAGPRRHGAAHDRGGDPQLREAAPARSAERSRDEQARPGAGRRRHRFGQVDVAGGDDRPSQPHLRRPHHHRRRPGRVRAHLAEVADHAPRSRRRHAVVASRAEEHAAPGAGRDPGRRDPRCGNHGARDRVRRDRPPVPVARCTPTAPARPWNASSISSRKNAAPSC